MSFAVVLGLLILFTFMACAAVDMLLFMIRAHEILLSLLCVTVFVISILAMVSLLFGIL